MGRRPGAILYPDSEGCRLVLIETIGKLTGHTLKDMAGWHVCLDVVETLLDGGTVEEDRKRLWEPLYEQYKRLIDGLQAE